MRLRPTHRVSQHHLVELDSGYLSYEQNIARVCLTDIATDGGVARPATALRYGRLEIKWRRSPESWLFDNLSATTRVSRPSSGGIEPEDGQGGGTTTDTTACSRSREPPLVVLLNIVDIDGHIIILPVWSLKPYRAAQATLAPQ